MIKRFISISVCLIFLVLFGAKGKCQDVQSIDCQVNADTITVGKILLEGNDITVDRIILRELEFTSGDRLSPDRFSELINRSRENLLNRSLFNFVEISCLANDTTKCTDVNIKMTERWYIWPLPIFELADRNFNVWWKSKDFSKVNYGLYVTHNNFRGRNEKLKLLLRAGYNQNYFLSYEIPYLTRRQNFGIGIQSGWSQSRELAYITENDKQLYYKNENGYAISEFYAKLMFMYRQGIHNQHNLSITYENMNFADSLLILNPDFNLNGSTECEMFSLVYNFKHDYRDSKAYPLNGHYFDAEINQKGLGFFENSPDFFTFKSTFDFYKPIQYNFYWASSFTAKFSNKGEQPYFLSRGLGFGNDFVRSYEMYVVDGQNFGLVKNNLKYALLSPRTGHIPGIRSDKFGRIHYAVYLNWLLDAGFVYNSKKNNLSKLQNTLLYGTGFGLDLVTYYDLVFRLEYSVNHLGQKNFYIHFMAPI